MIRRSSTCRSFVLRGEQIRHGRQRIRQVSRLLFHQEIESIVIRKARTSLNSLPKLGFGTCARQNTYEKITLKTIVI
jgi:hypothetical protein